MPATTDTQRERDLQRHRINCLARQLHAYARRITWLQLAPRPPASNPHTGNIVPNYSGRLDYRRVGRAPQPAYLAAPVTPPPNLAPPHTLILFHSDYLHARKRLLTPAQNAALSWYEQKPDPTDVWQRENGTWRRYHSGTRDLGFDKKDLTTAIATMLELCSITEDNDVHPS